MAPANAASSPPGWVALAACQPVQETRADKLSGNVDPEKVEAEYSHGVVTIHVKQAQATVPKRIEVQVR